MFDKNIYTVGEWIEITVEHGSKNIQVDELDSITITIQSDSESDAKELILLETGQNTGIFSGMIQLSSSLGIDSLYVDDGDSIHAMYLSFIKTASVKSSSSVSPILISTDKDEYKVGEIIGLSGSVSGGDTTYDVILSVVDPNGNTIYTEEIDLSYIEVLTQKLIQKTPAGLIREITRY